MNHYDVIVVGAGNAAFAAAVALFAVFRFSTPIVPIMPVCLSRYVARATWLQLAELTAASVEVCVRGAVALW